MIYGNFMSLSGVQTYLGVQVTCLIFFSNFNKIWTLRDF